MNWRSHRLSPALLVLIGLALLATSCGGDGDSSAANGGGGSGQSGQVAIQEFGSEASDIEASQAEGALLGYLDAQAGGEWSDACSYMARPIRRLLGKLAARSQQVQGDSCADVVETTTDNLSTVERADLAEVEVDSVRVEGRRGYVLYADAGDVERSIPVMTDTGEWKIAAVSGTPLKR